jgi:CheY-like chemotaxis protein
MGTAYISCFADLLHNRCFMGEHNRLSEFEARLAALKHKLESGLVERARLLRELAQRLEAGEDAARKEIKTESHKLRGVAGTYGHGDLTELAGKLEQRASLSPPAAVGQMARELAELAETKGRRSNPPPIDAEPIPPLVAAPSRAAPPRPLPPSNTGPRLRVLAMDDDPITQRLLSLTLTHVGGFDASIVASAAEALALLAAEHFDVVVSDAMMPDMNGRDFRREARARGATMPIVILSAATAEELGWAEDGDARGPWMRKPFKPTQLVEDLRRLVKEHGT